MTMDGRAVAMGLAFSLMWSSAFATARVIVTGAPPLAALSLRFSDSGVWWPLPWRGHWGKAGG